ncbi:hypothetical protein [Novosphingobium sp. AAP83]|uniref:hypothetical protein n=1 Tax=Novosphingobium sp. AAP83 TaxID=1523425 RepID=UPI0006B90897|nr:hypothetical protein [Novosphingobium sp. AAP83]
MIGKFAKVAIALAGMATAMLPLATEAQARPGWGGGRHWRGDRGIDGGDVLAGLLILGGIAAIASAASKSQNRNANRDQDYRDPDSREPNAPYRDDAVQSGPDARNDWRPNGGPGGFAPQVTRNMNDAVERCVDEASRSGEVDEVFDAARNGDGYRIAGAFRSGDRFSCDISGQGGVLLDIRRGQP